MIERLRDDNAIAWRPTDDMIARAQLTRFISFCGLRTFDELYSRSVADVEWFTERVLRFLDVQFDKAYDRVVDLRAAWNGRDGVSTGRSMSSEAVWIAGKTRRRRASLPSYGKVKKARLANWITPIC